LIDILIDDYDPLMMIDWYVDWWWWRLQLR